MKFKSLILAAVCSPALLACGYANAGSVIYNGETTNDKGAGFGSTSTILAVTTPGNSSTESGSVSWNGTTSLTSGDATNSSQTLTAAAISTIVGGDAENFSLIFNINEPGSPGDDNVLLHKFSANFYDPSGSPLFSAVYDSGDSPLSLTMIDSGQGGAGHIFHVLLSSSEATQFFGDPNNRLGMSIDAESPIQQASGGAESFYMDSQYFGIAEIAVPVPLPNSMSMGLILLGALMAWQGYRRYRLA